MKGNIVYTVGHSNRRLEEFLDILKSYNIRVLVDVRRFPKSRKFPHFNRDILKSALEKEGIVYYWLGDLLGGFRTGGYERYMKTEEFKDGIRKIMNIILKSPSVAIMCKEKFWFRCHRKFISNVLVKEGIEVIHIVDKEKTYTHPKYRFLVPDRS